MSIETVILLLFLVASVVVVVARWLKMPYTVALVVAGLALGAVKVLPAPHLTKDLLYAIFLPGLIFEAAFHLGWRNFRANARAILGLAVPGVALAVVVTTALLVLTPGSPFGPGAPWQVALVFAALIAATDPIAVVALFKTIGAPPRLSAIVEGESLVNDGTAVVVYTLVLAYATGAPVTVGGAVTDFLRVVGIGAAVGVAVGWLVSQAIRRVEDSHVEITLTTIAAYGSFVLAERFHLSGIIATVAAGLACGTWGAGRGMSPTTRVAVVWFWEYVAFVFNSVIFLLIGLEVSVREMLVGWRPIVVAFVAVTLTRALVVGITVLVLRPTSERVPRNWAFVLTWGGLRGALVMVLALLLPQDFPARSRVVQVTYGVVILTILLNGMTTAPLLKWLKIVAPARDATAVSTSNDTEVA